MKSITKRSLENQEIEKLVKNGFGEKAGVKDIKELTDGWYNAAFLITLSSGYETILKISPAKDIKTLRYEKNIMDAEVEVLRFFYENGRLPVPRVLYYDNSKQHIDCDYYFMEKLKGNPYSNVKESMTIEERRKIENGMGRYNRRINETPGKSFGYYAKDNKVYDKWSECFMDMIMDILEDGKELNIKLPVEYSEMEELIKSRLNVLEEVKEPRLIHWDLWDGNVFVDENGNITGIIDFERSMWADPLMEAYFGDFNDRTYFCEGYGEDPISSHNSKCRRIMYNIYLYLIMAIESYYRGFEEDHKSMTYNLLKNEIERLKAY